MITCYFENHKSKAFLRHVTIDGIIEKNGEILLVKRADFLPEGGKYALPGGFLNRNETTAEGVKREVEEETGFKAKKVVLFRINDDPHRKGEDRQNVDFVFLVKIGEKITRPDKEVIKTTWFDLNRLPKKEEIAFDHWENILLYIKYKKKKFGLPIIG